MGIAEWVLVGAGVIVVMFVLGIAALAWLGSRWY